MACLCLTLNCNGLRDVGKRRALIQWLMPLNPSFLLLQETYAVSDSEISSWFSPFGHLLGASHHTRKSVWVAIVVSHSSVVSVSQKWRDNFLCLFFFLFFCFFVFCFFSSRARAQSHVVGGLVGGGPSP